MRVASLRSAKAMNSNVVTKFFAPAKSFLEYIQVRSTLDTELANEISTVLRRDQLEKSHLVVKDGMVAQRLYFIEKGAARAFYYHDGKDITSWIYREGQLITSWTSFYTRVPSHENVELTEDSTLVSLTYDQLQDLYRKHSKFQEFGRTMVEEQLVFLDHFYKGFMFMTAREKYDLLLSIFPDATQRVNLGHIASFLGISQETLSRIRKKQ